MQFREDTRKFYREIGKNKITTDKPAAPTDIEEFWKDIWSVAKRFNEAALWLEEDITITAHIQAQEGTNISAELGKPSPNHRNRNRQTLIRDQTFDRLNSLKCNHTILAQIYSEIMRNLLQNGYVNS